MREHSFRRKKCIGAHICVRLIEEGGTFFIEVEINGINARFALASGCIPTYTIGIAHLDVCVTPNISSGHLSGVFLTVKACVGADIGPVHLEKCWDLYKGTINFGYFDSADFEGVTGMKAFDSSSAETFFVSSESPEIDYADRLCK